MRNFNKPGNSDKLNKFLKNSGFKKVELIYYGLQASQEQLNRKTKQANKNKNTQKTIQMQENNGVYAPTPHWKA